MFEVKRWRNKRSDDSAMKDGPSGHNADAAVVESFTQHCALSPMANIGSILKDEIVRLSRKAQRQALTALQSASTRQRREIASLKREVASLKRDLARIQKAQTKRPQEGIQVDLDKAPRFQARGLKSLRAKLDLGASDFGSLVGVSGQTIYNWESEKSTPRRAQLAALTKIRGIGKKEARARLANAKDA